MTIYKGNQIIAGGNLPTQTGKSGKFLKTDGSNPSWESVDALPSQSGQNGKYLTTNGTQASWGTIDLSSKQDTLVSGTNIKTINSNSILGNGNLNIDALPSQTGQNGKYLTTDGSSASWGVISGGANTDLSNLSAMGENHFDNKYVNATALSEINPMITSYINGTSGYNIWANGFCEQWGHWGSGEGTATITFTKTYRDTSYQIFIAQYGNPYDYGYWGDIGEKSTIGFKYYSRFSAGSDWRTYGYLAEGQY